jgi:hypothetical protein
MGMIQRQALLQLGVMRTTATDTLEAHANILLIHLLLDKHRHRATLQMVTLPESHPLYNHLRKAIRTGVKRHRSPLHKLLTQYKDIKTCKVETIVPIRKSPKWKSQMKTEILDDREEAKRLSETSRANIKIFTDGLGYKGGIGVVAVLYWGGSRIRTLRYHLGKENRQVVYRGEAVALALAMQLLKDEDASFRKVIIGTDNQAAIRATTKHTPTAGHALIDLVHTKF